MSRLDDLENELIRLVTFKEYENTVLFLMEELDFLYSYMKQAMNMDMSNETYFFIKNKLEDGKNLSYNDYLICGTQRDNRTIIKMIADKGGIDDDIRKLKEEIKLEKTKNNPFICPLCGHIQKIHHSEYKAPEIEILCGGCKQYPRMNQWKRQGTK